MRTSLGGVNLSFPYTCVYYTSMLTIMAAVPLIDRLVLDTFESHGAVEFRASSDSNASNVMEGGRSKNS